MCPTKTIRLYGIVPESIVDGSGYRTAIFVQGCPHHCPGCHNPGTHDPNGGKLVDIDGIIRDIDSNPLLDGITLTGGEPFCQPEACLILAKAAHARGLDVWAYSGWTYEELIKDSRKAQLLEEIDVLVDGRFVLEERTLSLPWRGSKNQRLIDMRTIKNKG